MNIAFISYSRLDFDIAVDLQRKLEKYPYPHDMVDEENRPEDPRFVRKVFLDITDLPVKTESFSKDIKNNLKNSKYLIVICSENSLQSDYVKKEIDYFLETHDNNSDLIVAIYVDNIMSGFHPVIDKIVATRNCPIYVTGKGDAGAAGRKYCFYHLLEFLLKVDFDKLYNRYERYKRRKTYYRHLMLTTVVVVVIGFLVWALISQISLRKTEIRRAETQEKKAMFEQKTFPFSIVVGYVGNFLKPMVRTLRETEGDVDIIVYMPNNYSELNFVLRYDMYKSYLSRHYGIDSTKVSLQSVPVASRRRDITIPCVDFYGRSIYIDNAATVSAFKAVIDYKLGNKDIDWGQNQDQMVRIYTDEFIKCSNDSLMEYRSSVHFVCDTLELERVLKEILVN